jgi:putative endonuclease
MRWYKRLHLWWRKLNKPLTLGQLGEREAARFLKKQGMHIVARGDRAKLGEIDLVAVDQRMLVFVEVKTRTTHDAGHPADAVDRNKQKRLTRAAQGFLKRHDLEENAARFDVIAVTWPDTKKKPVIEHYRHAFEAVE